ncbi:FAD-binding protein [Microvirga lotononidis]|uniref:Succinate dehydrogenase/fumarate reductase flavoprotein subunit n=1 Tax=Microvirga lotononidis TaxID=864069 RepID=I4Z199_9HYPH|nr:FAD-binding protein [Microvirga lotononidis]EIM29991.1 succinate dehydrogenase/fumarate reductase flavoprotein subunit [Microvirga lotononidis]WQO31956.1 FAD-binding protein [Microvirga lotononidis]
MAHNKQQMLALTADVLVIGGGLAGTWAASAARRAGASVILVDKGYCGTSGVTATAGPGHWWIPPDPAELRETAIRNRLKTGFGLNDPRWMARILDKTWTTLPTLEGFYDFSRDPNGVVQYRALRGPEYMRALRHLIDSLGVTVLDHSPALELIQRPDGSVSGARGVRRQTGEDWQVEAGAVVLATGGTSFLSRLLGSHTNTGDGYLMAAEAGAELSGMEFTSYYTVAPARSTMTRSMSYAFATYYDESGSVIPIPAGPETTRPLARALLRGRVFCDLHRTPDDIRARVPTISPNFLLPFRRWGIDPYRDRFEVTLHGEGTIRGIGGLRITTEDCQTSVPGLYAAGDAATRELVAGAISGGGNINSAWAVSSGQWAGAGAARFAKANGPASPGHALGQAGLRPAGSVANVDLRECLNLVQDEMLSYNKNIFRDGGRLRHSVDVLERAWRDVSAKALGVGEHRLRTREVAAMLATARWCAASALARDESRGMHQREDRPTTEAQFNHRILVGGLGTVWTRGDQRQALELAS